MSTPNAAPARGLGGSARNISTLATLVDAAIALARGRPKSAVLLLGAAVLSSRVPGLGTLVSVALRVYRRLR
ncbi:hypothetical protein [Halomicrobium salinisoli]|uniref:hypothetical protein n=1 Tax=Halomicrobium salinisoli TaxID=2878391 RepID=UPI001CF0C91A|nr:hypothetical protein [Halomicrobium salinisoli]